MTCTLLRHLCAVVILTLLVLQGSAACAAQPISAERLRPDERLRLDATLAHPAWQRATPHTEFVE